MSAACLMRRSCSAPVYPRTYSKLTLLVCVATNCYPPFYQDAHQIASESANRSGFITANIGHSDTPMLRATSVPRPIPNERFRTWRSALAFFGNSSKPIAESSIGIPRREKAPYIPPAQPLTTPVAYGPTKPPILPMELINATPAATADPVKNSQGIAKKGAHQP